MYGAFNLSTKPSNVRTYVYIYNTLYYIYYIYILSHLQVANPSYQWIVMDYPIEKKVAYNSL
jgi:hypothetical protein